MNDLKYKAKLDIEDVKKAKTELLKMFKDIGIKSSDGFSGKPLSEYQAGLLKIKQETLDLAKAKAEQARIDKENAAANKSASLATQAALKEERLLLIQKSNALKDITLQQKLAAQAAKEAAAVPRKVDFGNSSAEVAASMASNSTGGVVNPAFTQYLKQVKADFDAGKISAAQYTAELERYSTVLVEGSNQTRNATKATKDLTLSKKELEKIAAQEKLNAQQNAAALKNSVREMNAAKGSIEQRRAALIRLNTVYDNLNATERNSASGQRLKGIIAGLTTQVKTLEAETGRAQRNVGNYTSAFANGASKAWNGLKQIANILPGMGIAGLLAFAIEPITEYIGKLDLFKSKATEAKLSQENVAKALAGTEYAKAVTNVNELRINIGLAKDGVISKESVLKKYNETIGKTTGQVKNLDEAEQSLNKNADAFIKVTLLKAAAQVALESAAKSAYEAEISRRKKLEEFSKVSDGFGQGNLEGINTVTGEVDEKVRAARQQRLIKQREDARKKEAKVSQDAADDQIKIAKKFQEDAAKISKASGFKNFLGNADPAKTVKDGQAAINAQRTLQAEIDALVKKAQFKSASDDEQELAAIDAKYDQLREKAIAFNNDVIKFNADAKNKIKKQQVDIGGLGAARTNEKDVVIDKFAAISLKATITEQKALYDEYESYKLKVGAENAKKLAGDKIDTEKTYLQYLQGLEDQLSNDPKAKGSDEGKKEQQLKVLRQSIAEQTALKEKQQRDDFISAFEAAKTLTQKILEVNETFEKNKLALGANASEEQIRNLEKTRDKAISTIATSELTNSDIWANLFGNLDELTGKELDTLIKEVEKQFNSLSGSFDPIDLDAIRKKLKEAKAVLLSDNPFAAIGQAIKELNNDSVDVEIDGVVTKVKKSAKEIKADWNNLAKSTEAAFDFVNDAVQSADFLKDAIGEVGATAISSLLTIASVSIAVSTAIKTAEKASVILAIISAALAVVQAVANVLKGIFAANDKRIEKSIQSQKHEVELLTEAYADLERAVTSAIGENIYRQQQLQIENLKKQQAEITKMRDAETSKKKADQSKIDDYNQQIKEAGQKIIDVNNQIAESLIQTNFKDLSASFADALVSAFQEASDAGEAFDKVFNQTIANAIKNSLKLKLLEPVIAEFTQSLADYAKNNGNSVIGFDFETYRKKLKDAADLFSQGIAASSDFFEIKPKSGDDKEISKFIKDLGDKYLKALETSDLAKKVEAYNKRLADATSKGLLPKDVEAFKKEYDELAAIALQKQDEFFKLTGQKIEIDPLTLTFIPIIPDTKTIDEGAKSIGDKLFDLITKSAEETGVAIEDILKDAILSGLQSQIITDALKPLADKVKALYANGNVPTKAEIEALKSEMTIFVNDAKAQLKTLEEVTGLTFGETVKGQIDEAASVLNAELKSFKDTFVNIFSGTENSMADFEANWDRMIKNTILKKLQTTTLEDKLKDFYENFNKLNGVEDSKKTEQLALLKAQYDRIIKEGKDEYERLQGVFGVDYGSSAAKPSTAIGEGVQRITEDTANAIAGPIIGTFEQATKIANLMGKHYAIATQNLEVAMKIEANTRRGADNTDGIGSKLDEIARNTRPKTGSSLSDNYTKL